MRTKSVLLLARLVSSIGVAILIFGRNAFADALDNWTTQQLSTNRFSLSSIVYGNGCYVAAGSFSDYGTLVSSEDGYHWTVRADGYTSPFGAPIWGLKVSFADGRFIAVSAWGGTVVSTNGTNWILGSVPVILPAVAPLYLNGATFGGGRYVAVGQLEPGSGLTVSNIATSADGVSWTLRRSHPTEALIIVDVAYGAGTYVAIGPNDGFTYTSPTATTWTRRSILGGGSISFCNGLFIVPFSSGTNLLSTDGINWTSVSTGITNLLEKVTFAAGLFMARTTGYYLATSFDGTNWFQYSQTIPGFGVASDNSRLVTVSGSPLSGYSDNAFVFTSDALVGLRITNNLPHNIVLSGLVGRSYLIESLDLFAPTGSNSWKTNTILQLPSSPYLWTDPTASTSIQRFYRTALLP